MKLPAATTDHRIVWTLLAVALAFRLWSINFGLPALNDPDELMFELGAVEMLRTHSLNPGWFGHPATTIMYCLALIDVAVFVIGYIAGWFASPAAFVQHIYHNPALIILPGRIAIALMGLWVVWLTGRLAKRIAGREVQWAAMTLLALSPVHVAWSQIIRADILASAFLMLAVLNALDIMEGEVRIKRAALWTALAMASKWPFGLAALPVVAALAWRWKTDKASTKQTARTLLTFGSLIPIFLFMIVPYLLIEHAEVIKDISGEAQIHHLGATGGGLLHNAWWYLSIALRDGFTMPGLVLCLSGIWCLRRSDAARVLLVPLLLGFMLLLSAQHIIWERWTLPLLPLLAVFGGAAMAALAKWLSQQVGRPLAVPLTVACACLPMVVADGAAARERANNTAQQASRWAAAHIPPGSTVMVEHFGFDLLNQPWRLLFPAGDIGCADVREFLAGHVSYQTIAKDRGQRANVDFGTIPADRRATCNSDYAILTQYDRYRAEAKQFPKEYAAYRQLLAKAQVVATFVPERWISSGRIVRIVRFSPGPSERDADAGAPQAAPFRNIQRNNTRHP